MKNRTKGYSRPKLAINLAKKAAPNPLRIDPTRTASIRRQAEAEIGAKFSLFKGDLVRLILDEDALALNVFCATGEGGGVDPTCSPGKVGYANKSDLSGIKDDDVRRRVETTLQELTDTYGVRLNGVKTVVMKKDDIFDEASAAVMTSIQTARGGFKSGGPVETSNYLDLDVEVWTDKSTLKAYRDKLPSGYLADTSAAGMLRHEFAHALEKLHPEHSKVISEVYQEYRKQGATVSEYSVSSSREMVAEAFSHYHRQGSLEGTGLEKLASIFESWKVSGNNRSDNPTANVSRWESLDERGKMKAFKDWLRTQVRGRILGSAEELWRKYAEQAWRKGVARAFDDTKAPRKTLIEATVDEDKVTAKIFDGTKEEFLRSAFNAPVAVTKLQALAARSYNDLEGVTEQMSTVMTRTLVDGLAKGENPNVIARSLAKNVDEIGKMRAQMIARTEIIRAHAEGQLDALEELGVDEVGVMVEWTTTGDERLCNLCRPLSGITLKVSEARGMLPRHPSCRCAWIPANTGEEPTSSQKRARRDIEKAVKASAKLGSAKDTWGPGKAISSKRPTRNQLEEVQIPLYMVPAVIDLDKWMATQFTGNVFCSTGKGGGVDPTCSPGNTGNTIKGLSEKLGITGDPPVIDPFKLGQFLKENGGKTSTKVRIHGMYYSEKMHEVQIEGIKFMWYKNMDYTELGKQVSDCLSIPTTLLKCNSAIVFSSQDHKDSEWYAKAAGRPGMKVQATGGDGQICIYNVILNKGLFAHESGHNLAKKLWDTPDPPDSSEYAKAHKIEKPISSYGATHISEDFAECCRWYATTPNAFKSMRPLKYEAIRKLVEER